MSKDFLKTKSFKIACIIMAILIILFFFGGFIYEIVDFFTDKLDEIQNMPIENEWDGLSQFVGIFAWIALLIWAIICIPCGLLLIGVISYLVYKIMWFIIKKHKSKVK